MAHGAPDWVQMTDVNIHDYQDVVYEDPGYMFAVNGIHELVNVSGIGSVGLIQQQVELNSMFMQVHIDGVQVYSRRPWDLFDNYIKGGTVGGNYYGLSMYDTVNKKYSHWVNFNYNRSFRKTFRVTCVLIAGAPAQMYHGTVWYKLKV